MPFKKQETTERVLAVELRPKTLEGLFGQDDLVKNLKTQLTSGRIPHFFLICGPVGGGKTTLGRIIADILAKGADAIKDLSKQPSDDDDDHEEETKKTGDVIQINASDHNGVDFVRDLIVKMRYKPVKGHAKVVILDEAHQLTKQAQNALLTEIEEPPQHAYWIFCTSADGKIEASLKRRAYILKPAPMNRDSMEMLLRDAAAHVKSNKSLDELLDALETADITSPGLVLQAAERYFAGAEAEDSVYFRDSSPINTMVFCQHVFAGRWKETAVILQTVTKADVYMLRASILGYMKSVLLKKSNFSDHAMRVAKAMELIAKTPVEDSLCYPMFVSSIFQVCEIMTPKVEKAAATSSAKSRPSPDIGEQQMPVKKVKRVPKPSESGASQES